MRGVSGLLGCNKAPGCDVADPSLDLGCASGGAADEKDWLDVGVGVPWGRDAERGGTTSGERGVGEA